MNLDVNQILRLIGLSSTEVESILSDHESMTSLHDDFNAVSHKLMYDRARMYRVCKQKGFHTTDALTISRRLYPSNMKTDEVSHERAIPPPHASLMQCNNSNKSRILGLCQPSCLSVCPVLITR